MVLPYKEFSDTKKEQVANMFNNIAPKYDFLNHLLSLGIDRIWRRRAISILKKYNPKSILDVATGTGDFAIASLKANPQKVVGVDISDEMLNVGKQKLIKKDLSHIISLENGDSENLRFDDSEFDAVISAFGVRNFENLNKGLSEMCRVIKSNGVIIVLEFSKPQTFPFKQLFGFYFSNILPFIGRLFSKDKSAYTYLPESVKAFPEGKLFLDELEKAGFTNNKAYKLAFGIATIYLGQKL